MTEAKHSPLPELPTPKVTYADHSYPAFSKQQVTDYAQQAIAHATSLHHELVVALEAAQAHLLKYTGGFAANKEEATVFDKMRSALQKAKQGDKP